MFRRWIPNNLYLRVLLPIIASMAIVVALVIVFTINDVQTRHSETMLERGQNYANILTRASGVYVARHDTNELRLMAQAATDGDQVQFVAFYANTGEMLAAAAAPTASVSTPISFGNLPQQAQTNRQEVAQWSNGNLEIAQPILYQGRLAGSVALRLDSEELDTIVTRVVRRTGIAAIVLLMVIGMVVGLLVRQLVVVPLRQLRSTVDQISAGRWALPTGQERADEFGIVARSFSKMLSVLEARETQITLFARADGRIIEANQAAVAAYGYDRATMLAKQIADLQDPTTIGELDSQLQQALADGLLFETIHCRADGTTFPVEVNVRGPVIDDERVFICDIRDTTERKQTEAALRASEQWFRLLYDCLPDGVVLLDPHDPLVSWPIVECNDAACAMNGYTREELIGHTIDILHTQAADPAERAAYLDRLRREGTLRIEATHRRKDGTLFSVEVLTVLISLSGREFVLGIDRDITARQQAEETRALLATIVDSSEDAIIGIGLDRTVLSWNRGAEQIYGFTAEEIVGQPAALLLPSDSQGEGLHVVERIKRGERIAPFERPRFRKDGHRIDVVLTFSPIKDSSGRILGVSTIARDNTARKQAEEALRRSEWLYRTLAHNFPNGAVMLFDHNLRYTVADGAGLGDLDGLSRESVEGRTIWEVHPPELIPMIEARARSVLAGTALTTEESHGERTFIFHLIPVRDEHGTIIAGMIMTQDITERKRIENALEQERALLARRVEERTADLSAANAELARAARLKDEFLASMSHELRTPLNTVLGISESLREEIYGSLNDRQERSLQMIEESGRHLLELINDVLDLAKIGAGKLELEIAPVAVTAICQASLRLVKQSAQKKQIALESSIDPTLTSISADARRLKQMLVNLLTNAIKFTPSGGRVGLEVCGDAAHNTVRFTVWDTGIGIAPEQLDRLFQPFVQLDSRLARQYEGTGLGLALVYRMAVMHAGGVAVSSAVGVGSRFTVSLPWHGTPALPAEADTTSTEVGSSPAGLLSIDGLELEQSAGRRNDRASYSTPVILLAEDNEATITMVGDYLATLGYQIVVTRNGAEAVARARELRPAMILMDIQMPGMDGLEAAGRIRAEEGLATTPIVALTALAMPGDRERCIAAGANDYISKPISLKALAATIEQYLPLRWYT